MAKAKHKKMSAEDRADAKGKTFAEAVVVSHDKGRFFTVEMDNGHKLLGLQKGWMANQGRMIVVGDRVKIVIDLNDLTRCHIDGFVR
jgi:translation initiation factor IF-1